MVARSLDTRSPGNEIALQVIGAGPAGMSFVLALCNRVAAGDRDAVAAQELLDALRLFEAGARPGGKMGHYRVNANTSAHDVVLGIADGTPFAAVRDAYLRHPDTQNELIPLPRIEELMVQPLVRTMVEFLGERLHCEVAVERIEIGPGGFSSYDAAGTRLAMSASLLLCCGAGETPLPQLLHLRERWESSTDFLLRTHLDGLPVTGPIVIVGASHSAFSCAWRLLYDPLFKNFSQDRDIVILQRRTKIKLRATPEFAALHAIDYDPQTDICPYTGLVFRNGGLRKDAKMLYLKIRDGEESRVRLVKINSVEDQQSLLDHAALILQATGFVSRLPVIEREGRRLDVGDPTTQGELRDRSSGEIVPGLFGMGLGLNIVPPGPPRGEPSFYGGIHGFQSYPLSVAPGIIDSLLQKRAREQTVEN